MRKRIASAEVGDDVFGDDPTVNELEAYLCEISRMESSLFCMTGTLSNQLAVRSHLNFAPPYSVLCDKESHVYQWESSGIFLYPIIHLLIVYAF